jgi:hypothetical protein
MHAEFSIMTERSMRHCRRQATACQRGRRNPVPEAAFSEGKKASLRILATGKGRGFKALDLGPVL